MMTNSLPFASLIILFLTLFSTSAQSASDCPVLLRQTSTSNSSRYVHESRSSVRLNGGLLVNSSISKFVAVIVVRIDVSAGPGVRERTERRICVGTLVSSSLLVTSAKCFHTVDGKHLAKRENIHPYVGATMLNPPNGQHLQVVDFQVHPNFNIDDPTAANTYDIAWARITSNLDAQPFMKVNADQAKPLSGQPVRTVGYGREFSPASIRSLSTSAKQGEGQDYGDFEQSLKQVDLPVETRASCQAVYRQFDEAAHFCAGYFGGSCGPCADEDDGAPLFQYDEAGHPILIGLSVGHACQSFSPSLSIRVSNFLDSFLPAELTVGNPTVIPISPSPSPTSTGEPLPSSTFQPSLNSTSEPSPALTPGVPLPTTPGPSAPSPTNTPSPSASLYPDETEDESPYPRDDGGLSSAVVVLIALAGIVAGALIILGCFLLVWLYTLFRADDEETVEEGDDDESQVYPPPSMGPESMGEADVGSMDLGDIGAGSPKLDSQAG